MVGIRHRCVPVSRGGGESRPTPKIDAPKRVGGAKAAGLLRQTDSSDGRATSRQDLGRQFEPVSDLAGIAPGPREFKRPLAKDSHKTLTATKPWEAEGMSRATWYRRQKEKRE